MRRDESMMNYYELLNVRLQLNVITRDIKINELYYYYIRYILNLTHTQHKHNTHTHTHSQYVLITHYHTQIYSILKREKNHNSGEKRGRTKK
jgi:hypothetical protein